VGGRRVLALVTAAAALAAAAPAGAAVSAERRAVYALAGDCRTPAPGEAVSFKATGLGTFLLTDRAGQLVGVRPGGSVGQVGGPEAAGPAAEWAVRRVRGGAFTLRSTSAGRGLVVAPGGTFSLGARPSRLALPLAGGCATFPEAGLDASGRPPRATNRDGTIHGFADTHLHVTADMRAGGSVISGAPFDRFGIVRALGRDAAVHGADGGLDATGNLLRSGVPFGTHDTGGWPTFAGWPTHDTNTHQQVYFRWLQRAWLAGLRLVVAETVEDTIICRIEPRRRFGCDETAAIRRQVRALHALQDYVDAQAGGPGRGWLRIVTSPAAARRVMERGKLAVVIGVESSFPLGCRAERGQRCTAAQADRRLAALRRLGVRSLFVAHWADNGFAGAAIEGGVKGKFINAMQRIETGRWFDVARCPHPGQGEELQAITPLEVQVVGQFFPAARALENAAPPDYPAGRRCNVRALTPLGRHLVKRMLATGMVVELDHMSERARDQVLAILRRAHRPAISGHNGTGGAWTTAELRTLTALGGVASQTPEPAAQLARAIVGRERYRAPGRFFGVGLGTDTGGFAALPGPAADAAANPLRYPFTIGGVRFERQRTGERTFDLNTDGVAHYGLLPDLLADMERRPQGRRATRLLFRSAEAYLRMWARAVRRR
jgi:microsomal dipeptidase-like Zn-dependent dipeptidase